MRLATAALPLAALLAWSQPAGAGPLAEVAQGVDNKIETHQDSPSAPSDPPPDDSPSCLDCDEPAQVSAESHGEVSLEALLPGPAHLDLYVGVHPVVDSQGALIGDVRASKDWFGVSASNSSYFEEGDGKRGAYAVRMDVMAFAVNLRILDRWRSQLWIDGGLSVSTSTEYEAILGSVFGLRAEHEVGADFGLVGQGRMFRFEYDVSAVEAWAGVRAWFVSAGYRVLQFNVGPALHGPEAGLAFHF